MRLATACKQCRDGKRKCSFGIRSSSSSATCLPCEKRNLSCSRATTATTTTSPRSLRPSKTSHPPSSPDISSSSSLTHQEICEFVALYLRYVHDRPHSLFHVQSLWEDLESGTVDQCLILAICAIGCRFATDLGQRNLYTVLGSRASVLFSQQLEELSLSNVQTTILLANFYAAKRDNELEGLYFGIANRTAYILRLHETNVHDPPILRETKCRVWWSLFMADRWCPPALGLPREVVKSDGMLELPMDEVVFQSLRSSDEFHNHLRSDGLWKHKISLVEILDPIQDLNISLLSSDHEPTAINNQVSLLEAKLDLWAELLPWDRRMNDTNLELHRSNGQGGTFVALHLGFHHYSTLLYFQYLDTSPASTTTRSNFAQKCRSHALTFSKLLNQARNTPDCHVVYLTVAHMTMVSSSVLLHTLLFGDEEVAIETARIHLVYNFEALVELGKYWPQVDHVIERLLIFQNACLRSRHAHRIDKWMVRFLLEHALPFGDNVPQGGDVLDTAAPVQEQLTPSTERLESRTDMLSEIFTHWYENGNR